MMGYGGYGGMFGFGGFGMIASLLFLVGLVALVVWAAPRLLPSQQVPIQDTALETLRRRYASGEISEAEYRQAKDDLA
ncbi:MAG: SHOCT domain-containing protein [Bacteroidetes bacterium]|nr:SHOCT domain-containing protein [Bacteroidota bacterium]